MSESYHIEDEVHQRAYDSGLMRRLMGYVNPFKRWIAVAIVMLIIVSVISSFLPWLNMHVIDAFINNPERIALEKKVDSLNDPAGAAQIERIQEDHIQGLHTTLFLMLALMIAQGVIRYSQALIVAIIGQKTMLEMRMQIFEHLQRMSLRFLDRNPVGRLMTRVTNDVERIQQTIVNGMVQVASDLFAIVVIVAFMVWWNWVLALVTLATVPLVFVSSLIFRKYARRTYLEIRKKIAAVNAYMQENVAGMRVVQIFGQEDRCFNEYSKRNAEHRDEWFRQIGYYALYLPVVHFFANMTTALIVLYIGYQVLGGGYMEAAGASVGALFAYIQWGERLYGPIRQIADRYNMLLEAMAASERIFKLLDTPEEIADRPEARECDGLEGTVEFDQVRFAYEEDEWILKDVSFQISKGERLAIVGHTGAGKTTIISLLSRFYDIQQGAIRIDGVDVRDYKKNSLRRHIGVVLQDVFLFSGTIEENIRLGADGMSEEWVRSCAEYVNASRFIERLPGQYQYDVGERGCNLSTGQRQLIAFARTLAHKPDIVVLDEATSSVDTETEGLIQDAIEKLMRGRTCVVIAHRLSTVQHADRIVVMHHGEVREEGTHQELLAKGGLYRTLYELQYKDQDIKT